MKVTDRDDIELSDGSVYSWKVMENGELRKRVVTPDGTSVSVTVLAAYEVGSERLPWQDAHFHKGEGRIEVYVLQSGWAAFITRMSNGEVLGEVLEQPGQTITFNPGVEHQVLLGPESVISTIIFGEEEGNPDRKGNDWWKASDDFLEATAVVKRRLISRLRERGML